MAILSLQVLAWEACGKTLLPCMNLLFKIQWDKQLKVKIALKWLTIGHICGHIQCSGLISFMRWMLRSVFLAFKDLKTAVFGCH